jgi:hypothetical protein
MITAKPDGVDIRVIVGNGYTSHFIRRDPRHVLAQSRNQLGNPNWGLRLQVQDRGQENIKKRHAIDAARVCDNTRIPTPALKSKSQTLYV